MATASSVLVHANMHREREAVAAQRATTRQGGPGWRCHWPHAGRLTSNPGQRQQGFTLIELMIVIAILAILMALAIPTYTTYVARGKVAECLSAAGSMKMSIGEVAMQLPVGTFPADADQAGINPGAMTALKYCDAGLYANTGVLTLQVDEAAVGVGGTIEMVLVPTFNGTSSISWDCQPGATSGDAMRYLPPDCRM